MLPLVAFFYFNPRSHERSDKSPVGAMFVGNNISIHAPTRGATGTPVTGVKGAKISIHAPTRGATHSNTASHTEDVISIHAPTRGATVKIVTVSLSFYYFNPRSHERSDSNIAQKICLFLYNTDNKYIIR